MIIDALLDALLDTARSLPFLFGAYLLMEALERHSEILAGKLFSKKQYFGPFVAAVMGLVPQCGFSAALSNMYVGGIIHIGTLIAVFLTTSDEALLIMISRPEAIPSIWKLLLVKFIVGLIFGYLLNFLFRNRNGGKTIGDICQDENCGCEEEEGILKPAIIHTLRIIGWIFAICFILNILVGLIGEDKLAAYIGGNLILQPFLTALLGLVPNCAVSVLFTELYIGGSLSFGSAMAGLCSGAGLGLIVLFKMLKNKKECVMITAILFVCAAVTGLILNLFM